MADQNELDKKLQDAAQLALDVADKNKSWIWQLVGGLLLAFSLWYVRRQLDAKAAELAKVRTELELSKLEAQQKIVMARFQELQYQAQGLEEKAKKELEAVLELEKQIRVSEEAHAERVKRLQDVESGDWTALNRIAGVKP